MPGPDSGYAVLNERSIQAGADYRTPIGPDVRGSTPLGLV